MDEENDNEFNSNICLSDSESDEGGEDSQNQHPGSYGELHHELESFRQKWHSELRCGKQHSGRPVEKRCDAHSREDSREHNAQASEEETARNLFMQGSVLEQNGQLFEAVQYYRKALHLVPDIHTRLDLGDNSRDHSSSRRSSFSNISAKSFAVAANAPADCPDCLSASNEEEMGTVADLLAQCQYSYMCTKKVCLPDKEPKSTHISVLPMEVILRILSWVLSGDMDFRSVEMFSAVCHGFYMCAWDQELWKKACMRVWGVGCRLASPYGSWREMLIKKTRPHFNGCYISKTSYIRQGENNFQDQFYRPWYLVEYYRYLRFFPEGTLLMLTSSEPPAGTVGLLKSRHPGQMAILAGTYHLQGNTIIAFLNHSSSYPTSSAVKHRKQRGDCGDAESRDRKYIMELEVRPFKRRHHWRLFWRHYSIREKRGGQEIITDFELSAGRFAPFWFSVVKSYSAQAERPLF